MLVFGIHPVLEALKARRVAAVRVADKDQSAIARSSIWRRRWGFRVHRESPERLESRARGHVHQGVVAELTEVGALGVADLVRTRRRRR